MKLHSRLLAACVLAALMLPATPACAFDHDVHYAWTYYLAQHTGFTKRQAFQIASAAYSIDEDKETNPLENSGLRDGIFGAERGFNVNTKVTKIWRDFHCFEKTGASSDEVRVAQEHRFRDLWDLAVEMRNPGPLIHYVQDSFSHHGYDDTRGHFSAGHAPDFMSADRTVSSNMTNKTLQVLSDFRTHVFKHKRRRLDMNRIAVVMDRMIAATKSSFLGRPDLGKAVAIVNEAVREDEKQGLLLFPPAGVAWDANVWGADELPSRWQQFDNDEGGRVKDPAYAVEAPVITVGALAIVSKRDIPAVPGKSKAQVEIRLRGSYTLKGAAPLLYIHYVGELPILEIPKTPGSTVPPALSRRHRLDGEHTLELTAIVDADALTAAAVEWSFEVLAPGLGPQSATVALPTMPSVGNKAGGRIKFKPLSKEDADKLAGVVGGGGTGAGAKTGAGGNQPKNPGTVAGGTGDTGEAEPLPKPVKSAADFYDEGRDAFQRQNWKAAESAFQEAVRIRPGHARYWFGLTAALIGDGRAPEAEASAREAVKLDPGDHRNRFVLAFSLLQQKMWPTSETELRQAIKLQGDVGRYHALLGLALFRQDKKEEAQTAGREGIRLGYVNDELYRTLGLIQ